MSSVMLGETETIERFSDKLMLLTENITSIKDENGIISYEITNSRDSRKVFQLIEKYSVLKYFQNLTDIVMVLLPIFFYNLPF